MFKRSKGYITTTNPNTLRIKNVPPPKSEENILKKGHTIAIQLSKELNLGEIFLKEGDSIFEENGFFIIEKIDKKHKFIFRNKINKDAVLMITHLDSTSLKEAEDE